MTNYDDRGAYTPRDEPLAFDARGPRGGGGGRAPTTLILSAGILLLLAAAVFFYYRSGIRHQGEAPRVLGQPVTQMSSVPPASEQPSDAAADMGVYKAEQAPTVSSQPSFAPEPEKVLPRPAPPPPVAAQPVLRPAAPVATNPAPAQAKPTPAQAPAVPAPIKPAPVKAAPVKPTVAKPESAELHASPAAVAAAGDTSTPAGLAKAKAAKAAAAAASATASEAKTGASGPGLVQIGAFSNAEQAERGWQSVATALPGEMAGKGKKVEQVNVGGKTFQRTFVTGFASRTAAQSFCRKLTAAGKSCIVR